MDRGFFDSRHECDSIDIAAVWPATAQIAPLPLPEIARVEEFRPAHPAPAAPDIPAAVGGLIAASYAGLIVALAIATAGSARSISAILIAAFFVVMFFAVPRIFFAVEPDAAPRARLDTFMREGIMTLTGPSSGGAALVQMLIVPVSLTLAVLAMGLIIALGS